MGLRSWLSVVAVACLSACVPLTGNQGQDTTIITQQISTACISSGLFKAANSAVASLVPAAVIPVDLVNAGIDMTCENPAFFAHADAVTLDWVIAELAHGKAELAALNNPSLNGK